MTRDHASTILFEHYCFLHKHIYDIKVHPKEGVVLAAWTLGTLQVDQWSLKKHDDVGRTLEVVPSCWNTIRK